MTLSSDDIVKMRQWLGDEEPTDTELQTIFGVFKSYDETVLYFLNKRMADLSLEPASLSVPGLSISHSSDLEALRSLIKEFKASGGTGLDSEQSVGFTVSKLVRKYPR